MDTAYFKLELKDLEQNTPAGLIDSAASSGMPLLHLEFWSRQSALEQNEILGTGPNAMYVHVHMQKVQDYEIPQEGGSM